MVGSTAYCNRLLIIQKRAVRIISNVGHRGHTAPLFANLRLLKFNDIYHLNLWKFMYKYDWCFAYNIMFLARALL